MPRQTTVRTPLALLASITLELPRTLVLHGLQREELAGRHLLERGGVEHEVDASGGPVDAVVVADVADVEAQPGVAQSAGACRPA